MIDYEAHKDKAEAVLNEAEWLFCLDFNIFHRTKTLAPKLQEMKCVKILIDHHEEPDVASFDYGVSDKLKSSTSEMIYDFIAESGNSDKITETIGECIYAGSDLGYRFFPFSFRKGGCTSSCRRS
ncbi:MAG: DHH family phosphoesterase [Chitinophagaceae bacterium]